MGLRNSVLAVNWGVFPEEIWVHILSYSSAARAKVCQVSHEWYEMVMRLSAKLSPVPGLWSSMQSSRDRTVTDTIIASGDIHLLLQVTNNFNFHCEWIDSNLRAAYKSGDMDMIAFVKERHRLSVYLGYNRNLTRWALEGACEGGHMKLVRELLAECKYGKELLKDGAFAACIGGQLEVFREVFDRWNFDRLEGVMVAAFTGGNTEIIRIIYDNAFDYSDDDDYDGGKKTRYYWGLTVWENCLEAACKNNSLEAVRLALEYGRCANEYFQDHPPWEALALACNGRYLDIIQLLFSEVEMFSDRIEFEHMEYYFDIAYMFKMYIEYAKGAFTVERCLDEAIRYGYGNDEITHIMEHLLGC